MKLPRRNFLHLAAGAAALPAVSRLAWAQAYPSRPVRIIVGAPPGGAFDILARLIGQWLSERFRQPFIVENRPGAGTNIGTEAVVKAAPDGYTLSLAVTTATRSDVLPDIPTVGEFLPGYESSQWYGVGAPKNTPPQVIHKLNKELNAALDDPKMKAHLADLGGTVLAGSPADFGKMIAEETEKWGKVIRALNIKAD
jgi:tripartite-type tricarboxylate transporter receptor subunit TctC